MAIEATERESGQRRAEKGEGSAAPGPTGGAAGAACAGREADLLIQQGRMASMGEMVGYIAHQWRQPLHVLALQVQELRMSHKLGLLTTELVEDSTRHSLQILQHLSQTIEDFRDFLRPDLEKRRFRVTEVIEKSVSLMEASLREHGITLEVAGSGDPQVDGHPNQFGQALINVLMNAKDALAERRQRDARIEVRSWSEGGKAVVTVRDNAGGIEEEIIDRIFDPYFSTKPAGKGTGVGLSMSNLLLESMGGRISARNVSEGAEFRIEV